MQTQKNHIEKRREPRFSLSMPAYITPIVSNRTKTKTYRATIEDISLHGLKSSTKALLHPGQEVNISYLHLQTGQRTNVDGCIRWQVPGPRKYRLGIELYKKNVCSLTLEQATSSLSPAISMNRHWSGLESPAAKSKWPGNFHFEYYWGLFLKTFQRVIGKNLIHLSSNYSLGSAHLEKVLQDMDQDPPDLEITQKLQDISIILGHANSGLFKLVSLFQIMTEENIYKNRACLENLHQKIDLGTQLEERVDSFRKKLDCLDSPPEDRLFLESINTGMFRGSLWSVNYGLDYLILYAYQFVLSGKAAWIKIRANRNQELVLLDFEHNGSAILSKDHKEILLRPDQTPEENLQPSDRRHLNWLQHVLFFFNEFNPAILVKSSPGNNLISLRLEVGIKGASKP